MLYFRHCFPTLIPRPLLRTIDVATLYSTLGCLNGMATQSSHPHTDYKIATSLKRYHLYKISWNFWHKIYSEAVNHVMWQWRQLRSFPRVKKFFLTQRLLKMLTWNSKHGQQWWADSGWGVGQKQFFAVVARAQLDLDPNIFEYIARWFSYLYSKLSLPYRDSSKTFVSLINFWVWFGFFGSNLSRTQIKLF